MFRNPCLPITSCLVSLTEQWPKSLVNCCIEGMKSYQVIWGLCLKPRNKDPKIKQPLFNGMSTGFCCRCSTDAKWMFPKVVGFPPKSSILIGFSIIFTIHFGGNTPISGNIQLYTGRKKRELSKRHGSDSITAAGQQTADGSTWVTWFSNGYSLSKGFEPGIHSIHKKNQEMICALLYITQVFDYLI